MAKFPQKRLPLIVLTACLALAAASADVFVLTHLEHDCSGGPCAVCLQIEIAQSLLEGLGRIGLFALALGLVPQIAVIIKGRLFCSIIPKTLISLKVKYNT